MVKGKLQVHAASAEMIADELDLIVDNTVLYNSMNNANCSQLFS